PIGAVMVVPVLITLIARRETYSLAFAARVIAASLSGIIAILVFFAVVAGDPLAFVHARSGWNDFTNASFISDFGKGGWEVRRYISNGLRFRSYLPVSFGLWMDVVVPVLVVVSWR